MSLTIKSQLAAAMLTDIKSWTPKFDNVNDAEEYVGIEIGSTKTTEELVVLGQKVATKALVGYVDKIYQALVQS